MKITAIKTDIISAFSTDITEVLERAVSFVPENSVIAITSKIISLCEGSVEKPGALSKDELIEREADLYLPKSESKYGIYLTVKNSLLMPNAGIDESNTGGYYVLWPRDPQASANRCFEFIRERYNVEKVGVVVTDSTTTPLRWGVRGISISHCGFDALNSSVGRRDLFGRKLSATRVNIADGLAAAAVLCMGESTEQTPLALIEDLPFVVFHSEPPSPEELAALRIDLRDDLFGQLWKAVRWVKGKK